MHRHSLTYIPLAATVAVAVCACACALLVSAPAVGASANVPSCALPYLAALRVQQKIIERAVLGIGPLLRYVWNTRIAQGRLELVQSVDWLDWVRTAQMACGERAIAIADLQRQP